MSHLKGALDGCTPKVALILGSGLDGIAALVEPAGREPYAHIPGMRGTSVPGHAGELLWGQLAGCPVAVFRGRIHYYEGHDLPAVVLPVRLARALGARALVLTAAAGGIAPALAPGDLMLITDHINLMGANPLRGVDGGHRFVDLTRTYAPELQTLCLAAGRSVGVEVKQGVYAAVAGPSYETPAEIRYLGLLGADCVGMSVVPEAIVAAQEGLRTLAIAVIANQAAGLGGHGVEHADVLRHVGQAAKKLGTLVSACLPGVAALADGL